MKRAISAGEALAQNAMQGRIRQRKKIALYVSTKKQNRGFRFKKGFPPAVPVAAKGLLLPTSITVRGECESPLREFSLPPWKLFLCFWQPPREKKRLVFNEIPEYSLVVTPQRLTFFRAVMFDDSGFMLASLLAAHMLKHAPGRFSHFPFVSSARKNPVRTALSKKRQREGQLRVRKNFAQKVLQEHGIESN